MLSCFYIKAEDNNVVFENANKAYAESKYADALKLYEPVAEAGYESAELYYNMGNAYFKANNIAKAILYFEKAKKLSTNDEDIDHNLKLANQKVVDKMEAVPEIFMAELKTSFLGTFSEKGWSVMCLIIFFLSMALFALYIIASSPSAKQTSFFSGFILLFASIIVFFIARSSYNQSAARSEAIIMKSSVTVKGSPDENGTKLFVLHEGSKVKIEDQSSDWLEIKLPNGNTGWVKSETIEKI